MKELKGTVNTLPELKFYQLNHKDVMSYIKTVLKKSLKQNALKKMKPKLKLDKKRLKLRLQTANKKHDKKQLQKKHQLR